MCLMCRQCLDKKHFQLFYNQELLIYKLERVIKLIQGL